MLEVFGGFGAQEREAKSILPCDFSMASAPIATELGEDRDDLVREIHGFFHTREFDSDGEDRWGISLGMSRQVQCTGSHRSDQSGRIDGDQIRCRGLEPDVSGQVDDRPVGARGGMNKQLRPSILADQGDLRGIENQRFKILRECRWRQGHGSQEQGYKIPKAKTQNAIFHGSP